MPRPSTSPAPPSRLRETGAIQACLACARERLAALNTWNPISRSRTSGNEVLLARARRLLADDGVLGAVAWTAYTGNGC
jgi:hypothetical protein